MKTYEAVCIFKAEDDKFAAGKDAVRNVLVELGASDLKEEDMLVRTLSFPIQKLHQGHYWLYTFNMTSEKAFTIEQSVKLIPELLRILVTTKDN